MRSREPRWTRLPRARSAAAGLVLLLGMALPGVPARAENGAPVLYQWTDSRGNVRYTPDPDRVPSSQRGTLLRLEPGAPAVGRTEPAIPPAGTVAVPPAVPPAGAPAGVAATAPSAGAHPAPPAAPSAGELAREQQLAAAIAADEETLKALISVPVADGEAPLTGSAQLREIARRLPAMQAELSALRERRTPPAGP